MASSYNSDTPLNSSVAKAFLKDRAVVTQTIYPNQIGRVRLHGVLWFATSSQYIPQGTPQYHVWVEIICRQGNMLVVQPRN